MKSTDIVYRVGQRYSNNKKFEDLCEVLPIMSKCPNNLTELLAGLNTLTDPNQLPTWIAFELDELERYALPVKTLTTAVQTTANLASIRLGQTPTRLKFSGFIHKTVSSSFVNELKQNQFVGLAGTIGGHGWEPCVAFYKDLINDHWSWPSELIHKDNHSVSTVSTSTNTGLIPLTARQRQVLDLIVYRGLSNKQIARHLGIGESAVKMHISILLSKYAVKSRTQLSAFLKTT